MRKYYTRACNFYHGSEATRLIQKKKALPLNGKNNIAFDSNEIFSREKREVKVNLIKINKVIIKIPDNEIKKHKEFIKTELKKNFY